MCHLFTIYVKEFRESKGMTQSELGFKIGKSQGYISQIESYKSTQTRSPKISDIVLIAEALNVCSNDLIRFKCSDCKRFNTCTRHENLEKDDDYIKEHLEYYI